MRILLVVYDNGSYVHWFPEGFGYISAVLQQAGHDVVIYNQDVHHWPDEHLTEYLDQNHFDIVGVSVVGGYYQYRRLLGLSNAINRSGQRPFYVIGGHGPSPEPEFFLQKTQADAVVIGEGEETILDLLDAVSGYKSFADVLGIAYREGQEVTVNPRRPLIEDLDSIPFPAYELFPMQYYRLLRQPHAGPTDFVVPVLAGRGCKFNCNFCYRMDEGLRLRSPENVIEQIRFLQKEYGVTYVAFSGELLMASKEQTMTLCEAMIKADLGIKWDCDGRLNYATPEVMRIMKQAGCVYVNFGIEAMDDEMLRTMKKGLTVKMVIDGIKATLEAGISPGYNIIFGNIGETREILNKGVEFLLQYDNCAELRTVRPVTPYPGCPLYYYAIEQGLLKDCEDFYENKHLNSDLLAVNFTDMTDEEVYQALLEANIKLIDNYFATQARRVKAQAQHLYLHRDVTFRGFRQL
ncbi:MAG: B12-binding domain-containing radical SAM protein [Sedimentisphaerales bacterium]|nr:B12-binding domain-containing radical SAM protein [Sedimentisphaerales bacterium]